MKNYLLILLVAAIFTACGDSANDGFRIGGKLENGGGIMVYLDEISSSSVTPMDSVEADGEGNYELTGNINEAGFYKIRIAQNNFVNIILNPKDNITLNGDANYLYGTYNVSGAADAVALYELNEYLRVFGIKTDSIKQVVAASTGTQNAAMINFMVRSTYNNMLTAKDAFLRNFIDSNLSSLASLAAVESLDPSANGDYYVKLDNKLMEIYPNSQYVKSLHLKAQQFAKLAVGAEAPQILLNNPSGETVALSSLRGKVVLIDFWASWCKPCRVENPNVVKVYNKYKEQGFEIYGVSLDKQMGAWVQAIQQDGLEWIHVSDLGFWNSAPVKLYNIKSIPQTYLLDKEGKIIAKGLRAAELEKKLAEIFG
ncbi:MAG: AhpC/TSA family protein [Flavobacteriales bacterium]|nr:AhpC/TSA family protein [Flavobacteriales bacterium]